jgi:hypothetical protein
MDDEVDDDVGDAPVPAEEMTEIPRETRGLPWIVGPALLGVVVGALVDVIFFSHNLLPNWWGEERTPAAALADGGSVGLIAGAIIGALIWAFFPYKRTKPLPQSTEPSKD